MRRDMFDEEPDEQVDLAEDSKFDRYLVDATTFVALEKDKIKVAKVLPPGIYSAFAKNTMMGTKIGFEKVKLTNDTVIDLPDITVTKILKTVNSFWSETASSKYAEYGLTRKLGILLYGDAGTGKTLTAVRVVKEVVRLGGIVLFNPQVSNLQAYLSVIRQIEPNKKVLVLWEEFDDIRDDSELLSIMDGELQIPDVMFLATTNYISKIPARLKSRRSRFYYVLEMKAPTEEVRRVYFNSIIKSEEDKAKYLEAFVDATDGLSIDSCKNLVLDVLVFGLDIADSVREMKALAKDHAIGSDDYNERARKEAFTLEKDSKSPLRGL